MDERRPDMTCEGFRAALTGYMDRSLPAAEERACSRHLTECEACRGLLEGVRHMLGDLEEAGRVQAPPELAWAVKRSLDREERRERERRVLRPIPFGLAAAAAAAALVLMSWSGEPPVSPAPMGGETPLTSGLAEGSRWERYVSPAAVDYRLPPEVRTARGEVLQDLDSLRTSPPSRVDGTRAVKFPF
ncbi:MAG: zf-HC2 domain-containing protein [bacterium]